MINESITFDKLPQAVSYLTEQVIELKHANSTSKCKITKCFYKSTPLVLRNSISFLVSH